MEKRLNYFKNILVLLLLGTLHALLYLAMYYLLYLKFDIAYLKANSIALGAVLAVLVTFLLLRNKTTNFKSRTVFFTLSLFAFFVVAFLTMYFLVGTLHMCPQIAPLILSGLIIGFVAIFTRFAVKPHVQAHRYQY